ncbi:LOW QUALITY PROTEIN: uncharacterized protein ACIB01_018295 [Guaruba guarouba]
MWSRSVRKLPSATGTAQFIDATDTGQNVAARSPPRSILRLCRHGNRFKFHNVVNPIPEEAEAGQEKEAVTGESSPNPPGACRCAGGKVPMRIPACHLHFPAWSRISAGLDPKAMDEKQCSSLQLWREELWKQAVKRSASPSPPRLGLSHLMLIHLMLIFAFPGMPRPKEPNSVGGRLQCKQPSGFLAEQDLMVDGFLHLVPGGHLHGSRGMLFPRHPGAGASGSLSQLGRSPWMAGGKRCSQQGAATQLDQCGELGRSSLGGYGEATDKGGITPKMSCAWQEPPECNENCCVGRGGFGGDEWLCRACQADGFCLGHPNTWACPLWLEELTSQMLILGKLVALEENEAGWSWRAIGAETPGSAL